MKILLLSHKFSPDIGGIESISEMLADCFASANHDVRVVTWSAEESSTKFSYPVIRKPNAMQLIKQHAWADVVFENNICLRLSWPAALLGKNSLVGLQTWINDGQKNTTQALLKYNWLKRAKAVVACSQAIKQGCWQKATVVGNPYKHDQFKILPGINRTENFVFVGRLVSDKGADVAIEAFGEIVKESGSEHLQLNIVGDGPERPILEQKVKQLNLQNNIHFLGTRRGAELVKCLNQHRYMLVPSKWQEPFGIVALEGMACGCIPFVSDSGGLPDAVGSGGITFKSGDSKALVAAIKKVNRNKDLQTTLYNNAQKHLVNFSSAEISRQYLTLFSSL